MNANIYYGSIHVFVPDLNVIVETPILGWETKKRWGNVIGPGDTARKQENYIKFLGYVPLWNIIQGLGLCIIGMLAIQFGKKGYSDIIGKRIFVRGLLTIAFGPLLGIADFAKYYFQENQIDKILQAGGQRLPI